MSTGCLCTCGHRTTQHAVLLDGRTPCTECGCQGFVHADDDPDCKYPNLPKNKTGRIDVGTPQGRFLQLLEPLIGPTKESK